MASLRIFAGLSTVVAVSVATILAPAPSLANNPSCCFAWGIAPICSPLDTPIRYYFIPRRPTFAPHDYCYQVRGLRPCPDCGAGTGSIPPELVDQFTPWEFERLGNIPGDPLLEAAANVSR